MKVNVMTFNTECCRGYYSRQFEYDMMADAIKKCDSDIVGLNEMRGQGSRDDFEEQVKIVAEKAGYPYYYFAKAIELYGDNPYGNGLISKYPIVSAETIQIPDPIEKEDEEKYYYETRCILKAQIDVEGKILNVLISHFGLAPDEKKNAVDTVMNVLPSEMTVLMGDFNMPPREEFLSPIKETLKDALKESGKTLESWPSDKPERRIDYIYITKDIGVVDADIPAIVASDHRPHTATISI